MAQQQGSMQQLPHPMDNGGMMPAAPQQPQTQPMGSGVGGAAGMGRSPSVPHVYHQPSGPISAGMQSGTGRESLSAPAPGRVSLNDASPSPSMQSMSSGVGTPPPNSEQSFVIDWYRERLKRKCDICDMSGRVIYHGKYKNSYSYHCGKFGKSHFIFTDPSSRGVVFQMEGFHGADDTSCCLFPCETCTTGMREVRVEGTDKTIHGYVVIRRTVGCCGCCGSSTHVTLDIKESSIRTLFEVDGDRVYHVKRDGRTVASLQKMKVDFPRHNKSGQKWVLRATNFGDQRSRWLVFGAVQVLHEVLFARGAA